MTDLQSTDIQGKADTAGRLLPRSVQSFLARCASQTAGFLMVAAGVLLTAAVVSYDPTDPSLFVATDRAPQNLLGGGGALAADIMLRTLGLGTAVIVLSLLAWGWRLLAGQPMAWTGARLIAWPPGVLAGAGLAAFLPPAMVLGQAEGPGGHIGLIVARAALSLAPAPSTLVVVLVLAVTLFASMLVSHGATFGTFRRLRRRKHAAEGLPPAPAPRIRAPVPDRPPRRPGFAGTLAHGLWTRLTARPAPVQRREPVLDSADDGWDADDGQPWDDEGPLAAPLPPSRIAAADPARGRPVEEPAPRRTARKGRKPDPTTQPMLRLEGGSQYALPPLGLLQEARGTGSGRLSDEQLDANARMLESVLEDFGIKGEIVHVRPGPVVTLYELEPAPGLKSSRVIGLADDIARSMSAIACRVATVPGRNVIGVELPNAKRETVYLRELLASPAYERSSVPLAVALGKDIGGDPVIADLAAMPHLLLAGATGAGKSVAINTMILSLLYRLPPDQCKLIMIDPKVLELSVYEGIPHLLAPVVTEPKKAITALKWAVREMEERYRKMSKLSVRDMRGYNARMADALANGETIRNRVQTGVDPETGQFIYEEEEILPEQLPYIVVIVDEMADLMMVAGKEIESAILRLAQMARAAGIHLVLATQRPSVDVITGIIKANLPSRISFQVTSKVDSRTILDEMGAEQLLGQGDMLYMERGRRIRRLHGPFVTDNEVESVVESLRRQGAPQYVAAVTYNPDDDEDAGSSGGGDDGGLDDMFDLAVEIVSQDGKCSTSHLQRRLKIGYNRAARIVDEMERQGIVGQADHVGRREVLTRTGADV